MLRVRDLSFAVRALNRKLRRFRARSTQRLVYLSLPLAGPIVTIDVFPPGQDEWRSALVERCEVVLGDGRCRLTDGSQPLKNLADDWRAQVRWQGDGFDRVKVAIRNQQTAESVTSPAEFTPADQVEERWGSVGLLIAAVVTARAAEQDEVPPPIVEPPKVVVAPPPPAEPSGLTPRVDLLGTTGPALTGHPWAFGGQLRLSLVFPLDVYGLVGASHSQSPSSPEAMLTRAFIGAGKGVPLSPVWELEPRLTLVAERVGLSVAADNRQDEHQEWGFGPGAGVDLIWAIDPDYRFVLGAEALYARAISVEVLGELEGKLPALRVAASAGLRWQGGRE